MGHLPPPGLTGLFERAAREGCDWSGLRTARSAEDLAALARPDRLRPALDALDDGGRIGGALGLPATLHLLLHAESARELKRLANVAEAAPKRSVAALEVLGTPRLLRLAAHLSDAALQLIIGLAGLIAAVVGLFGEAVGATLLRRLRRTAAD
ncbi:hypothetical protein [Rhodovulum sp. ES.010]|uniref:hypothetical protein n=1 Tax=Rhodovulum sp. ES.010 TaxID=1882821 RepID=UPI0009FAEF72|nr:hypothetical protein [Rhodovulum sp. ES.010]